MIALAVNCRPEKVFSFVHPCLEATARIANQLIELLHLPIDRRVYFSPADI